LKFSEIIDKEVYTENYFIGKVKDLYFDEEWKISHLEVELTKEASKELFGAKTSFRNSLAITAVGKWSECCNNDRINLSVSMGQLNIYLRPPK
jgi:sporulation protein YlmC with PRC-barrel domain